MNTLSKALVTTLALVSLSLAGVLYSNSAEALASPLGSLVAQVTSVGTTAEKVSDDLAVTTGWKSCALWNNSATPLHIGGPGVDATDGWPICTDTAACPKATFSVDVRTAYYISSSGTLTPNVICGR